MKQINSKSLLFEILLTLLGFSFNIHPQNLLLSSINESLVSTGINLEFNYTGEVFSNLSGGMVNKSVYLDNFDIIFNFDLEQMIGWKGAKVITYVLGNQGGIPSEYSGAVQGISNIAAYDTWKIYEFWIEQNLLDNRLSLLTGLFDLNSEFDTRETSLIFINPAYGIGSELALSGKNGPSIFPTTSLAFRARYSLSNSLNIKAALFDGIPGDLNNPNGTRIVLDEDDGLLLISEITLKSETDVLNQNFFKYSFGAWYYTGDFKIILERDINGNPLFQRGNYGLYLSAEKFLFSENNNMRQGLTVFIRAGIADKKVNQVDNYFGAGFTYTGLIPGRCKDIVGFAVATSHFCDRYQTLIEQEEPESSFHDYEYIYELTYSVILKDCLRIQPDIQYVINPGRCYNKNYALVFGTRLQLMF